jgi:hypothetical protein
MKQTKNFLPQTALKNLYFATIHPHLTYGLQAWGNATKTALQKNIVLQKRALRLIHKVPYNSHTNPLFLQSEILKLPELTEHQIALYTFDFHKQILPSSLHDTMQYSQNTRTTQSNTTFNIPMPRTTFVQRLPFYIYPKVGNIYQTTIENSNSQTAFSTKLKKSSSKNIPTIQPNDTHLTPSATLETDQ